MSAQLGDRAPRGRPRDPAMDDAILEATLSQLAEVGFAGMTVDSVAKQAGIGKPTVYRRWANKTDLATAALEFHLESKHPPISGDLEADLVAQLDDFRRCVEGFGGMSLIGILLSEASRQPDWLAMFRERTGGPRRRAIQRILLAGVEAGELAPDIDVLVASRMLTGAYYAEYLDSGAFDDQWAPRVVSTFLATASG